MRDIMNQITLTPFQIQHCSPEYKTFLMGTKYANISLVNDILYFKNNSAHIQHIRRKIHISMIYTIYYM